MGRPSIGPQSAPLTTSSSIHQYFLRSTSGTGREARDARNTNVSNSPCSNASESPPPERRLKKKSSIWSMFTRGSRKPSAASVNSVSDCQGNGSNAPESMSNISMSSVNMPIASLNQSTIQVDKLSPSLHELMHIDTKMTGIIHSTHGDLNLRSQRSFRTFRSDGSFPIFRNAKSQYLPRRPHAFDCDSIFSDDSEGDVSVSWVTSTGLRKVGMDDDEDDEIMDVHH